MCENVCLQQENGKTKNVKYVQIIDEGQQRNKSSTEVKWTA